MLELCVRDTGQGIAANLLPHVFDRFWQSQDPTRREHGGLGLGLAIARHLVEQHGGTIEAASDGVGHGAVFRIYLPAYEGSDVVVTRPAPARGPSHALLTGVDVLLVEDQRDTRDAIEYLLRSRGAAVRVAGTAADALALYQQQRPAIVISDLGLPRESGIDLILRIRADDEAAGIRTPAIAATGFVGGDDRQRALAAGFDAKVPKPVDFAVLLQTMLELLGRSATDR
jgi:CheY-like chemotaxis protein